MNFQNKVRFSCNIVTKEAIVINDNNFTIFDIFVFFSQESEKIPFRENLYIAHISSLQPREKMSLNLEVFSRQMDFKKPLQQLGFTKKETESFEHLWYSTFINYGKLIYRLPKEECDKIIELEFSPKPKKIIRAIYVLIK